MLAEGAQHEPFITLSRVEMEKPCPHGVADQLSHMQVGALPEGIGQLGGDRLRLSPGASIARMSPGT